MVAIGTEETASVRGLKRRGRRVWCWDVLDSLGSSSVSAWRDAADALSSESIAAEMYSGESSMQSSIGLVEDDGLEH